MSGFKLLGGGSTLNTVVSDMNTNILELKNQDVAKIFKDSNGTPVVILDANGLRTTAPGSGIDVTTANDGQLTSNSANIVFQIVSEGNVTISPNWTSHTNATATDTTITTINHNLGYAPIPYVFLANSGIYNPVVHGSLYPENTNLLLPHYYSYMIWNVYSTTSTLEIRLNQVYSVDNTAILPAYSTTLPLKYYLTRETAS